MYPGGSSGFNLPSGDQGQNFPNLAPLGAALPLTGGNLPVINVPGSLTPFAGSPQPVLSQLPTVPGQQFTGVTSLPTVGLPAGTPPVLPTVSFPRNTLFFDTGNFLLTDNQTADLVWNYPNPPRPTNPQSSYRRVGCIGDGSCLFHAIAKGIAPIYFESYNPRTEIRESLLSQFEMTTRNRLVFEDTIFDRPRNRSDPNTVYRVVFRERYSNKMDIFRHEFAKELRGDFAYKIQNDQRTQDIIQRVLPGEVTMIGQEIVERQFPNIYEMMAESGNGNLIEEIIETHPEIHQEASIRLYNVLIRELLSGQSVPPNFLVILSEYSNFDFYLLRDVDLFAPKPKNTPLYGGDSLHIPVLGPQDMRPDNDPKKDLPNRNAIVIISFNDAHYELVGRVDVSPDGRREFKVNFDQSEPLIRTLYAMLRSLREG